jgi:hypothetical protein
MEQIYHKQSHRHPLIQHKQDIYNNQKRETVNTKNCSIKIYYGFDGKQSIDNTVLSVWIKVSGWLLLSVNTAIAPCIRSARLS